MFNMIVAVIVGNVLTAILGLVVAIVVTLFTPK